MKKIPQPDEALADDADPARAERDVLVAVEPLPSPSPPRSARAAKVPLGRARRGARERALQALYQCDLAAIDGAAVRREFLERQDMSRVDVAYFERLVDGVSRERERVDRALGEALDRPLGDLDPIERAVLRIGVHELLSVPETPARVIIDEGVEITKRFGAENGHRYVNGVLDGLAARLRPGEMPHR